MYIQHGSSYRLYKPNQLLQTPELVRIGFYYEWLLIEDPASPITDYLVYYTILWYKFCTKHRKQNIKSLQ